MDERTLFPDSEVEGYTVRPWTLAQAVALAPTFGALIDVVEKSGVKAALVKVLDAVDIEKPATEAVAQALTGSWKDIAQALVKLVPQFLPHAPEILSVSLGVSKDAVGEFDLGKTTRLLKAIAVHNFEYLKNFFGPGATMQAKAS